MEGLVVDDVVDLEDEDVDTGCFGVVVALLVVVVVIGLLELAMEELVLALVGIVDVGSFDLDTTLPFPATCLLELEALFKPKAAVLVADAGRAEGLLAVREILEEDEEDAFEAFVEAPTILIPPELPIVRGGPEASFTFRFNFPGLMRSIACCGLLGELG